MEQICAKLRDVKLHFARKALVKSIQSLEDFIFILSCIECQDDVEDLGPFIFKVSLQLALGSLIESLSLHKGANAGPAILPIVFVHDFGH